MRWSMAIRNHVAPPISCFLQPYRFRFCSFLHEHVTSVRSIRPCLLTSSAFLSASTLMVHGHAPWFFSYRLGWVNGCELKHFQRKAVGGLLRLKSHKASGTRMRMVGLTGGIASGKSTVSTEFQALGLPVIDADKIAHAAMKKGTMGWRRVVATFGRSILQESGEVDRAQLGNIVFSDPVKRKLLNSALSLPIALGLYWEIFKHWVAGTKIVVLDIPLLFEAKLNRITKPIIVVWVDPRTHEERLMKRDRITKEHAANKINAQLPLDWKRDHADIVIDNSGTLEATKAQVHQVWRQISTSLTWKEFIRSRLGVTSLVVIGMLLWFLRRMVY